MWRGALLLAVTLAATPAPGQTLDELKRELAEREAEVDALRARIRALEQPAVPPALTPVAVVAAPVVAPAAEVADADAAILDDVNRALERALVRQGGLLLMPGTVEAELNFVYSHVSRDSTGFRRDAYGPGLAVRVGLPFDSQISVAVPYVFENRRTPSGSSSGDGVGDVFVSLAHQFVMESGWWPNVFASVGYRFATGTNTLFTSAEPVSFGSGFDALGASLTFTKRTDPLVLFGSYSFAHSFPDDKDGNRIDPGESHSLRLGALLATSPTTSLRAALDLTLFERTTVNDVSIAGTDEPAASIELGGSFLLGDATLLDLAVAAGLTASAPDFRITAAIPVRF